MAVHRPNPVRVALQEALGIDSFALDGEETTVTEPWQDRPAVHKTPAKGEGSGAA